MPERPLIVTDGMMVRLHWTVLGFPANNTPIARIAAGTSITVALAQSIFTAVGNLWTSSGLAALAPATTTFASVNLRDLRTVGMAEVASTGAAVPGTASAADTLPMQIAACLTLRTARAGKHYRGRMYLPGYAETANNTDNHMTAAAKLAFDNFAAGLRGAINQTGVTLGVAIRPVYDATDTLVTPGLLTDVTQVLCRDSIWDSQRRRSR